jgi:hypothetical protein
VAGRANLEQHQAVIGFAAGVVDQRGRKLVRLRCNLVGRYHEHVAPWRARSAEAPRQIRPRDDEASLGRIQIEINYAFARLAKPDADVRFASEESIRFLRNHALLVPALTRPLGAWRKADRTQALGRVAFDHLDE